jgi:hypothetical protein
MIVQGIFSFAVSETLNLKKCRASFWRCMEEKVEEVFEMYQKAETHKTVEAHNISSQHSEQ